jgi:hypothetical protein
MSAIEPMRKRRTHVSRLTSATTHRTIDAGSVARTITRSRRPPSQPSPSPHFLKQLRRETQGRRRRGRKRLLPPVKHFVINVSRTMQFVGANNCPRLNFIGIRLLMSYSSLS